MDKPLVFCKMMEEKVRKVPRRLVGCLDRETTAASEDVGEDGTAIGTVHPTNTTCALQFLSNLIGYKRKLPEKCHNKWIGQFCCFLHAD